MDICLYENTMPEAILEGIQAVHQAVFEGNRLKERKLQQKNLLLLVALIEAQHMACRERGYQKVRTYGRNARKAKLILNLKSGFEIVSTFIDAKGRHKIVFEKSL